jgi:hypothetical protein
VRQSQRADEISFDPLKEPARARIRNIQKFMQERLPDRLIDI